jgi:hypothetical protein
MIRYIKYFKESASDKAFGVVGVVGVEFPLSFLHDETNEAKTIIKRYRNKRLVRIFFIFNSFQTTKYVINKIFISDFSKYYILFTVRKCKFWLKISLPQSCLVYLANKRTNNAFSVLFIHLFVSKGRFQPVLLFRFLIKTFIVWIQSYSFRNTNFG